ncbi:HAD family phosphatase [Buchananella hordeovulneris]|nr:HAD family phosphatase [Buchananella hordeovulneris]
MLPMQNLPLPTATLAKLASFARSGGLLIDLDGTIINSEAGHQALYAEFFAAQGWQVSAELRRQFSGRRAADSFRLLPGPWQGQDPQELEAAAYAFMLPREPDPEPVPGARELVESFSAVCVVTSALRHWAERGVRTVGLDPTSLQFVTAETTTLGKPDPEPYRLGAAALNLPPARCLAVEDTPAGLHSARQAGCGFLIGLATSHAPQALQAAGADLVVPTPAELLPLG